MLAPQADALPSLADVVGVLTFRAGHNTAVVVLGTSILGLASGVVGVFALLRKRALVTDALSHATLPGIALAFLAATLLGLDGRSLPLLLAGGAATGVLGVGCIQLLVRATRLAEDAAIGIVLSVFFGAGVVALSWIQADPAASSSAAGLNTFIYGQTAAMSVRDAALMAGIAGVAVLAAAALFKELRAVCFDDGFAAVTGLPVSAIDLAAMGLVVLVTVAGLQAVGLILVVALLIIPPVAARFWTERLAALVVIAGLIGALSGYVGSSVSALLPRKPAGAIIVLTCGAIFAASLVFAPARGVLASALRRASFRLRIAREHLLEAGYERTLPGGGPAPTPELGTEAIDALAARRGWSRPFRALVLASVTRRGKARRSGEGGLVLTPEGLARGARVSRNHRLWEQYLISYADVAANHVDWSVDQVEHVLSDDLIAELEQRLQRRGIRVPPAAPVAGDDRIDAVAADSARRPGGAR